MHSGKPDITALCLTFTTVHDSAIRSKPAVAGHITAATLDLRRILHLVGRLTDHTCVATWARTHNSQDTAPTNLSSPT